MFLPFFSIRAKGARSILVDVAGLGNVKLLILISHKKIMKEKEKELHNQLGADPRTPDIDTRSDW